MRPGFVLAMAWRETRASRRRLLLFASAIAIGVAALVAIGAFTANLESAVRREARSLLGADLQITSTRPFSQAIRRLLDSTAAAGVPIARRTMFSSIAYVPRIAAASRLAEVRAVGEGFPFYGEARTSPEGAWRRLAREQVAIVDTSLLLGLGARIGDSLVLGRATFVIAGVVGDVPGRLSGSVNEFGSQVYIPERFVERTGLIVFGSRARYAALFKFDDPRAARRYVDRHSRLFERERVRARSAQDAEEDVTETLRNMSSFLQFVGLVALLLGGIGVASGITAFLAGKLDTIAVLRCLGARRPLVFAIYLVQAVGLGLVAAALGALLGTGLQLLLPRVLRGVLPLNVVVTLEPMVLLGGIAIGVGVSVLFALRPLLEVRLISPLQAIRKAYETERSAPRDPLRLLAFGLLCAGVLALCLYRNEDPMVGLAFAGAIAASVGVLALTARFAIWLARRLTTRTGIRRRWPYVLRQGLANLHRPRNQTAAVVTALGFGVGLLAALYLVQANMLRQVIDAVNATRGKPNMVFIDVQPDQVAGVETLIREAGPAMVQPVPMIPMRIAAVNGRSAQAILSDTSPLRTEAPWMLRREYRSSYRDSLVESETLVRGRWWRGTGAGARDGSGALVYPISISTEMADDMRLNLGDRISWDVQGARIETRVTSVRAVDWARLEPNFFVVFSSAGLARAPATWIVLTRLEDGGRRAVLQRAMAERYPNAIAFDITVIQNTVERIFGRVAIAVRFMAVFSLAIGTLVLLGAVAAGRGQRIREGALLKTLGATRRQLTRILLAEYLALGLLAALVGIVLASAGGWAFTRYVMELPFKLPALPLAGVLAITSVLVAIVGLTASREVFRRTAMEVLRNVE